MKSSSVQVFLKAKPVSLKHYHNTRFIRKLMNCSHIQQLHFYGSKLLNTRILIQEIITKGDSLIILSKGEWHFHNLLTSYNIMPSSSLHLFCLWAIIINASPYLFNPFNHILQSREYSLFGLHSIDFFRYLTAMFSSLF